MTYEMTLYFVQFWPQLTYCMNAKMKNNADVCFQFSAEKATVVVTNTFNKSLKRFVNLTQYHENDTIIWIMLEGKTDRFV